MSYLFDTVGYVFMCLHTTCSQQPFTIAYGMSAQYCIALSNNKRHGRSLIEMVLSLFAYKILESCRCSNLRVGFWPIKETFLF